MPSFAWLPEKLQALPFAVSGLAELEVFLFLFPGDEEAEGKKVFHPHCTFRGEGKKNPALLSPSLENAKMEREVMGRGGKRKGLGCRREQRKVSKGPLQYASPRPLGHERAKNERTRGLGGQSQVSLFFGLRHVQKADSFVFRKSCLFCRNKPRALYRLLSQKR